MFAAAGAVAIDAEANRILRTMGEYLKSANEFSFRADISYDAVLSTGEMVQFGGSSSLSVRRPDRLLVDFDGDEYRRQMFFDGSTITLLNLRKNLYAVASDVPASLDAAMDLMFENFGLTLPVGDLLYADPYAVLTEATEYGSVLGVHGCGEQRCHHLLFTQETIDWQIWIETGPRPVPRKLIITYKQAPGSPQYEAQLSRWDFQPRLSEHAFTFHPPIGASEIEFLPASRDQEIEQ
jgi:hypothetical protein